MNQTTNPTNHRNGRKLPLTALTVLAVLAAALTAVLLSGCAAGPDGADGAGETGGQTAIPGFETLKLKAGRTRQSVKLRNPKENGCYFRVSLILEDGETLWTSDLIAPGKSVRRLTLSRPLDRGNYPNAKVRYDCFTLRDQSPLNGAEIVVTLDVE